MAIAKRRTRTALVGAIMALAMTAAATQLSAASASSGATVRILSTPKAAITLPQQMRLESDRPNRRLMTALLESGAGRRVDQFVEIESSATQARVRIDRGGSRSLELSLSEEALPGELPLTVTVHNY